MPGVASDRRRPRRQLIRVLLLGLLAPLPANLDAQSPATPLVVETDRGAVRGRLKTNHAEWLGIPYAAPPVGPLRWRPPRPADSWPGVRDAGQPGNGCVQGTGWDPGYERPTLTEDCLFLNVYRPHRRAGSGDPRETLLPVFVWIHGGGLRGGAGYDVDPRKFVALGNVVFVTLNYRLGAMGFLALPSLSSEDPDAAGNYGMLDQQAALRWVQTNIRSFGGDPARVTIAGQSAGASSICNHLSSPSARGLFTRAIHQSGSCTMVPRTSAEEAGARFALELGCTDAASAADCLRARSSADILATQEIVRVSSPVHGGAHFPMDPAEAIRTGAFSQVPIVIGQTRDERTQSVFGARDNVGRPVTPADYMEEIHQRYGTHGDAVLRAYPLEAFWSPTVALATVEGDERSCVRRTLIGQFAVATPTYAYEFDEQDPPPFVSIWRLNTTFRFGATHVNDLGYIFDYLHQALPFSSAQMELSDQMIRYWSEFTWNGDPNARSIPDWPRYDPAVEGMLSLKARGTAVKTDFAVGHRCGFWALISAPPTG